MDEIRIRWDTACSGFALTRFPQIDITLECAWTHKHGDYPSGILFGSPRGNFLTSPGPRRASRCGRCLDECFRVAGRTTMTEGAVEADEQLVKPLFQFRNYGQQLPHHWSTISNEAAFGTDYFTRTAVAKSNIFVNAPIETKYFYQDLDASGTRLNGAHRYTVTFPKG